MNGGRREVTLVCGLESRTWKSTPACWLREEEEEEGLIPSTLLASNYQSRARYACLPCRRAGDHLWARAARPGEVVKLPHAERTRLSPEARRLAGVNTKKAPTSISIAAA